MTVTELDWRERLAEWTYRIPRIPRSYIPRLLEGDLWFVVKHSERPRGLQLLRLLSDLLQMAGCTFLDVQRVLTEDQGTLWFLIDDGGRVDHHGMFHVEGYSDPDLRQDRREKPGLEMMWKSGVMHVVDVDSGESRRLQDPNIEKRDVVMLIGHDLSESL